MVYTRCASDDYDRFARVAGDDGWSWKKILPYAYKVEDISYHLVDLRYSIAYHPERETRTAE